MSEYVIWLKSAKALTLRGEKMDKYKFHILIENPKGKKDAILQVEAKCPLCGIRNIHYWQINVEKTQFFRFKYRCDDCNTEWVGNCFKSDYTLVDVWAERMKPIAKKIMIGIAIFVFILSLKSCNENKKTGGADSKQRLAIIEQDEANFLNEIIV